ncbi:MAG: SDR family oxidoreductase [Nocardia sp.]|nr:SDR family oxidoreductase [Nocardia sp.]
MSGYLVTGGTSFVGRRVVEELLAADPDAVVHIVLNRNSGTERAVFCEYWHDDQRVSALVANPSGNRLRLHDTPPAVAHVIHAGAIADLSQEDSAAAAATVDGTRAAIELATELGATLHHLSSVVVAGDHRGQFFEDDFDLGQNFRSSRHRAVFDAERLVRESTGLRWRIYRTALVVGDSHTGAVDRAAGPYQIFEAIAKLSTLPGGLTLPLPDYGSTNIVPVDYVAGAVAELVRRPGLNKRTFHLVNPRPQTFSEIYHALLRAAGAPQQLPHTALRVLTRLPGVAAARDLLLAQLGVPAEILAQMSVAANFVCDTTRAMLRRTPLEVPEFGRYADALWDYWRAHLSPHRPAEPLEPAPEPSPAAAIRPRAERNGRSAGSAHLRLIKGSKTESSGPRPELVSVESRF